MSFASSNSTSPSPTPLPSLSSSLTLNRSRLSPLGSNGVGVRDAMGGNGMGLQLGLNLGPKLNQTPPATGGSPTSSKSSSASSSPSSVARSFSSSSTTSISSTASSLSSSPGKSSVSSSSTSPMSSSPKSSSACTSPSTSTSTSPPSTSISFIPFSSSSTLRIRPIRLAVKFAPPVLALEYLDLKHDKIRVKKFSLTSFLSSSSFSSSSLSYSFSSLGGATVAKFIVRDLQKENGEYLSERQVSYDQLLKLVNMVVENEKKKAEKEKPFGAKEMENPFVKKTPTPFTSSFSAAGSSSSSDEDEEYNFSPSSLPRINGFGRTATISSAPNIHLHTANAAVSATSGPFPKNQHAAPARLQPNAGLEAEDEQEVDDNEDEEVEIEVETEGGDGDEDHQAAPASSAHSHPADDVSSEFPRSQQESAETSADVHEENLNVVDEETLRKRKEQMEKAFDKNVLKPGDSGYEYEIEKEFVAIEDSGWDD